MSTELREPEGWNEFELAIWRLSRGMLKKPRTSYKALALEMAITVKELNRVVLGRGRPGELYVKQAIFAYTKRDIKSPLSKEDEKQLADLLSRAAADIAESADSSDRDEEETPGSVDEDERPEYSTLESYSFIGSMGINSRALESSIDKYKGSYCLFVLNDDHEVVTAQCMLSKRLGSDKAPIYRSWRIVNVAGRRELWRYSGAYFTDRKHLFLVSSLQAQPDARMSVFHVNFSDDHQELLRGAYIGVSSQNAIISCRAMLLRYNGVERDMLEQLKKLLYEPRSRKYVQSLRLDMLDETLDFLFEGSTIKLSFGS